MGTVEDVLYNRNRMLQLFLVFIAIVVIKVFLFPVYETEAVIMIDIKSRVTSVDEEKMDLRDNLGYIRIHEELLKSKPMLRRVVEELRLYEDCGLLPFVKPGKFSGSALQKEKLIRQVIENLQRNVITTSSPPFTNLIVINARYKSAEKAAAIVNCLVRVYMEWSVNFNHNEVENVIGYLDREVGSAQQRLRQSEEDLREFRNANNMVDSSEDVKLMYQFMKTTAEKELDMEVAMMREKMLYTDESPQVKNLKKNIVALQQRLEGIPVDRRFRNIPEKEMVLVRLRRVVVINEKAYRFLIQEEEKSRLIKAKQTTENIKVVSSADLPLKPKGRVTGLLIGFIIGFMLVFGVPLLWRHRKVLIG